MAFLYNPAFWASLGVLLEAMSIEVPSQLFGHILTILGATSAIIGIIESLWQAGHKVQYVRSAKQPPAP